jgi:hypothetical protein
MPIRYISFLMTSILILLVCSISLTWALLDNNHLSASALVLSSILLTSVVFVTWGYYTILSPVRLLKALIIEAQEERGITNLSKKEYKILNPIAEELYNLTQAYQLNLAKESQRSFRQGMFTEQRNITQNIHEALIPTLSLSQNLEEKLFSAPLRPLEEIIASYEHSNLDKSIFTAQIKSINENLQQFIKELREISFSLSKKIQRQQTMLKGQSRNIEAHAHFAAQTSNEQQCDKLPS